MTRPVPFDRPLPFDRAVPRRLAEREAASEAQQQGQRILYHGWGDSKGLWLIFTGSYEWMREDMAPDAYLDDAKPGLILESSPEGPELPHTLRYPRLAGRVV